MYNVQQKIAGKEDMLKKYFEKKGVDLKRGESIPNLVPQNILNKTSNFWPNASKIFNKCIPELVQNTFSYTFPCLF